MSAADPLADLLAAGERAALRGAPGDALAPLAAALEQAAGAGRRTEGLAAGWLLGVSLGACGRYGEALERLEPLAGALGSGDGAAATAVFGALAAATAASVYRQLGSPGRARELDAAGWAAVAELGPAADEARVDCALGMASDLVGLGEHPAAREWAERAAGVLSAGGEPRWRAQVRMDWVRIEIALLDDDSHQAADLAGRALAAAEKARAPRHVAKSLLFRGVALATTGVPEAVVALRRSAALAQGLGARPVVWPARALLGALLGAEGQRELAAAGVVVREISAALPAGLRADWLGRPDVAALLAHP